MGDGYLFTKQNENVIQSKSEEYHNSNGGNYKLIDNVPYHILWALVQISTQIVDTHTPQHI
jgi:hypothetical protein